MQCFDIQHGMVRGHNQQQCHQLQKHIFAWPKSWISTLIVLQDLCTCMQWPKKKKLASETTWHFSNVFCYKDWSFCYKHTLHWSRAHSHALSMPSSSGLKPIPSQTRPKSAYPAIALWTLKAWWVARLVAVATQKDPLKPKRYGTCLWTIVNHACDSTCCNLSCWACCLGWSLQKPFGLEACM